MAEPTTFPEEHVREPLTYQRISILAIVSCVLAVLYAVFLLLEAFLVNRAHVPFLSLNAFLQAIPVIAALLAMASLIAMYRSQGSLGGARLARTGLLVGAFSALGYWAYYAATYYATCQQANDFLVRWVGRVKDGKVTYALVDTIDPRFRQGINPEDEKALEIRLQSMAEKGAAPQPIQSFRRSPLVRPIIQGGSALKVEPLGVEQWDYQKNVFTIGRFYRLVTPESTIDIKLVVDGTTSPTHEWAGREWQVVLSKASVLREKESQLGEHLNAIRMQSLQAIYNWGLLLNQGDFQSAFLASLPATERAKEHQSFTSALAANLLAAQVKGPTSNIYASLASLPFALDTEAARILYLKGYKEAFVEGKVLNREHFVVDDAFMRADIQKGMEQLLNGAQRGYDIKLGAAESRSNRANWKYENNVLELPHDIVFLMKPKGAATGFAVEATITLGAEVNPTDEPPSNIDFRINRLEFTRGEDDRLFRSGGKLRRYTSGMNGESFIAPVTN